MLKLHFVGMQPSFAAGLSELAPQLNILLDDAGVSVTCEVGSELRISRNADGIHIVYSAPVEFYRALSMLPSLAEGEEIVQTRRVGLLCYMADLSRNSVFNVKACKRMLRYLALMGYDSMMLYTEDTYEIKEKPYFGRMRGRFSQDELRELDDYADMLGIELIPCIQALAHLGSIFRWPGFGAIRDMDDILLVGEEKTYEFVEQMIKTCASCFRSRKIHLGMDEAHHLGRGRYLDKNGHEKSSDIMLKHLGRVTEMCAENGLEPMIWSDMFFRMQFDGQYYITEGGITPEVIAKVPEGLGLVYWDYYTKDPARLAHMLRCHKQFDRPVLFAGGAWKWSGPTPHNTCSNLTAEIQMSVCLEEGVTDVIVTGWGDDGGEASQFSVMPNLLYWAEKGYENVENIKERCEECFDCAYDALMLLDLPDQLPLINEAALIRMNAINPSKYLLWNDPLEGLMDAHVHVPTAAKAYRENAAKLLPYVNDKNFGLLFDATCKLCLLMSRKCDLSIRIRNAYLANDKDILADLAANEIPLVSAYLESYGDALRKQWYAENKTYGFSVQEIRLGTLQERLKSTKLRIESYLAGEIEHIEELEEPVLSMGGSVYKEGESPYICHNSWAKASNACVLSHSF